MAGRVIYTVLWTFLEVPSNELRTENQISINNKAYIERNGNKVTTLFVVPDNKEYEAQIFARKRNEKSFPEKIRSSMFTDYYVPKIADLLEEKKISEKEINLFRKSYYEVAENQAYYYIEDQFDTVRNNALLKIFGLLDVH